MKKLTLFVAFTMLLQMSFAGGLLSNYNQSAQYVRMLSRNAALEIDAVFYNPAGLVKLEDGWHLAFHGQAIFQTREIDTGFPLLNNSYYEGETTIPIFPNLYAAYKKDKWAFSLGVGPAAGGGTAEFATGLPSLEIPFSKAVPSLAQLGVTGYDLDMAFDASSVYWGIQLGATYAFSDKFSVYGGARFVPASNTYEGYIRNIQLQAGGQMLPASDFLNGAAAQANSGAAVAYGAAGSMQPIIDNGGGGYSLAQLEQAGFIDATQKAQLEGGLMMLGIPAEQIGMMNAAQVQGTYNVAGAELTGVAQTLTATAGTMGDKEVKTKQTGFGVTPILGVNFSPNDEWTFAAKYEFKTNVTLENETTVDDMGLFPDGAEGDYDIPAILALGIGYHGDGLVEAQLSYNMYMDKGVDYGYNVRYQTVGQQVHRDIDRNHYEWSLGLQFNVSDNFAFSTGVLRSQKGVSNDYQSDFSFSNSANAFGAGIMWNITNKLILDAGISNIWYEETDVDFTDPDVGAYTDLYDKKTLSFAAGITYSIF